MQATWIVVKIDNQSDLAFLQAARSHDVEIQSISQKLQSSDQKIVYLDAQDFFGSGGGCKIIMQNPQSERVSIDFFGDPTHRVGNGRARYADLDSRNAAASTKESMLARVFKVQNGSRKLIGFVGYEQANQPFVVNLIGKNGIYQVQLSIN